MHFVLTLTVLIAAALAQQADPVIAHTQPLADVIGRMTEAVEDNDEKALAPLLASIGNATTALRESTRKLEQREDADAWLTAIDESLANLRSKDASHATRRYDFAAMRGSCTACHLRYRTDNDEVGLSPNRGNALFGTIDLQARDGTPYTDRSGTVVFLESATDRLESSPPLPRSPAITQTRRQFEPQVLVVTVGTKVRFPNNDVVFHNVFSRSRNNVFDLGTYGKGMAKERVLDNPGLVKVHCHIHPNMVANVLVLDNAFAAISTKSGFWSIHDVPDGEFNLRVWHPLASVKPRLVRCENGRAVPVELTVRETKTRIQHTNKHGRKYRVKY